MQNKYNDQIVLVNDFEFEEYMNRIVLESSTWNISQTNSLKIITKETLDLIWCVTYRETWNKNVATHSKSSYYHLFPNTSTVSLPQSSQLISPIHVHPFRKFIFNYFCFFILIPSLKIQPIQWHFRFFIVSLYFSTWSAFFIFNTTTMKNALFRPVC